jgi:hypothetical protein
MRLPRQFACGLALIAALLYLQTAAPARAQNSTPPTQPPASSPPTSPVTSPSTSTPSSTEIPDANKPPLATHGKHTVTVTFDYDFGQTPACSRKIVTACVQQFIAYDISAGIKNATMLFPIALPTVTQGAVRGITATSPLLDFESGQHLISVSAMAPNGTHSKRSLSTTWITIP